MRLSAASATRTRDAPVEPVAWRPAATHVDAREPRPWWWATGPHWTNLSNLASGHPVILGAVALNAIVVVRAGMLWSVATGPEPQPGAAAHPAAIIDGQPRLPFSSYGPKVR